MKQAAASGEERFKHPGAEKIAAADGTHCNAGHVGLAPMQFIPSP